MSNHPCKREIHGTYNRFEPTDRPSSATPRRRGVKWRGETNKRAQASHCALSTESRHLPSVHNRNHRMSWHLRMCEILRLGAVGRFRCACVSCFAPRTARCFRPHRYHGCWVVTVGPLYCRCSRSAPRSAAHHGGYHLSGAASHC